MACRGRKTREQRVNLRRCLRDRIPVGFLSRKQPLCDDSGDQIGKSYRSNKRGNQGKFSRYNFGIQTFAWMRLPGITLVWQRHGGVRGGRFFGSND